MDGKKFEEDFKKSVPDSMFILRLKDSGGWGRSENKRFSTSNICDFVLFDGARLFLLELKSSASTSIPQDNIKQLRGITDIHKFNVLPCIVFNFRKYDETYIVTAGKVAECLTTRKSVPVQFCRDHGMLIPQTLKRTRFKYSIGVLKLFQ